MTFGDAAPTLTVPTVTVPTGAPGALSYAAAPPDVCTVDPLSGALTLTGAGVCTVTLTAATTSNYDEATAPATVTVDTAGTLMLAVHDVTGDDIINRAEQTNGFTITGTTGTVAGATVTVTLGGTALGSVTSANDGAWSVTVPAAATYITGASLTLLVAATRAGYAPALPFTDTLTVDLTPPAAPDYTAPANLTVGVAVTALTPTGGTGIDTYTAPANLPPGLVLDTVTGVISGTPTAHSTVAVTATVTVKDSAGNTDTVDITFPAVGKGTQDLSAFTYSATSVTFGDTAPTVTVPTGAPGALRYAAAPANVCTVDPLSGALTLTEAGVCTVTLTAALTADYDEATAPVTVTVSPAGTLMLVVHDVTGDDIINSTEKANGFTITGTTGAVAGATVTVTLDGHSVGTATSAVAVGASEAAWSVPVAADAAYLTDAATLSLTVAATRAGYRPAPDFTGTLAVDLTAPAAPDYTAPANLTVGVAVTALTPTGGTGIDTYTAPANLPPGLVLDTVTGVISGTPTAHSTVAVTATVTVKDSAGNTDTVDITFPAVTKGTQDLSAFTYSATSVTFGDTAPTVTVPTGAPGALRYAAAPANVCTVDPLSGALTLTEAGVCTVTLTAALTADYDEATAPVTVTVSPAGTLMLVVHDVTGDDIINSTEKANGFTITGTTGAVAGATVTVTLDGHSVGTATSAVAVGASEAAWSVPVAADAAYLTDAATLSLTVAATRAGYRPAPDFTGTLAVDLTAPAAPDYTAPANLTVGVAVTALTPTGGTGIDTYTAPANLPPGLVLDTVTGVISGTPTAHSTVAVTATVTVKDSAGNSDTVDITFPAVGKGTQDLSAFGYTPATVSTYAARRRS